VSINNTMDITPIPAFDDNYIWALKQSGSNQVVVVDPGDEAPVLAWLRVRSLMLSAIVITHHHYDHVGGVPELIWAFPEIPVFGPKKERIRGVTHYPREGDKLLIPGLDTSWQVFELPGHTAGHLAYYSDHMLFCGDTLFAAGCGRVFDGTLEQLSNSLRRISQLPPQTKLYCAHEYTLDNLGFARWVEPKSQAIAQRIDRENAKREAGQPTVPSLLCEELETNPFLRTGLPNVVAVAEKISGHTLQSETEVFTVLRQWKDREYD
jgi:hydroxyacylglutathione hydrolase